jgi:hypothetical protein
VCRPHVALYSRPAETWLGGGAESIVGRKSAETTTVNPLKKRIQFCSIVWKRVQPAKVEVDRRTTFGKVSTSASGFDTSFTKHEADPLTAIIYL